MPAGEAAPGGAGGALSSEAPADCGPDGVGSEAAGPDSSASIEADDSSEADKSSDIPRVTPVFCWIEAAAIAVLSLMISPPLSLGLIGPGASCAAGEVP